MAMPKTTPGEKPKKPDPAQAGGVTVGDHLYFHHDKMGPHSGEVVCHGKDGATLKDAAGTHHQVLWDKVLGHKKRVAHTLSLEDQGEDGSIMKHKDGRRVFVQGALPIAQPAEPADLSVLEDRARMAKALDDIAEVAGSLRKTFPNVSGRLLFWKP